MYDIQGAVVLVPAPALLLALQTMVSCGYVLAMRSAGRAQVRIVPARRTGLAYAVVSLSFLVTIYSNIMVLRYVGVNAFVILRCSTPLLVSGLDWIYLGRELPGPAAAGSLDRAQGRVEVPIVVRGVRVQPPAVPLACVSVC